MASSPPEPPWGATQPLKRSADEFELDNKDISGSEPDAKRLHRDRTHQSRPDTILGDFKQDELAHAYQRVATRSSIRSAFRSPNSQVQQPRSRTRQSLRGFALNTMPSQTPHNVSEIEDGSLLSSQPVLEDTAQALPQVIHNQTSQENPLISFYMEGPEQQVEGEGDVLLEESVANNEAPDDQDNQDFASGIHSITDISVQELIKRRLFEIRKQMAIICRDPTVRRGVEYQQRIRDVWGGRYWQWETSAKTVWNIKEEHIPAASRTCEDLIHRQDEVLRIFLHRRFPPPRDKNSEAMVSYRQSRLAAGLYNQLLILQEWTAEWEVLFPAKSSQVHVPVTRRDGSPPEGGNDPSSPKRGHEPSPAEGGNDPSPSEGGETNATDSKGGSEFNGRHHKTSPNRLHEHQSQAPQTYHQDAQAGHMLSRDYSQSSVKLGIAVDEEHRQLRPQAVLAHQQILQADDIEEQQEHHFGQQQPSWQDHQHQPQIGYGDVVQPHIRQIGTEVGPSAQPLSRVGAAKGVSSFAGVSGIAHPTSNVAGVTAASVQTQQPSIITSVQSVTSHGDQQSGSAASLRPVLSPGQQQPSSAQSSVNISLPPPAAPSRQTQSAAKKRGAPRKVMFPNAPSADSPLPASALIDDEEVLERFPEHLSKSDVMKRFVKNNISRPGGYPTKDMVKILLNHVNAKDTQGIEDDERKNNLRKWVVKEKDSCNAKLRSEERSIGVSVIPSVAQPTGPILQSSLPPAGTQSLGIQQPQSMGPPGHIATSEPSQILYHATGQANATLAPFNNAEFQPENSHPDGSDVGSVNESFGDSTYGTRAQGSSISDTASETLGAAAAMKQSSPPKLLNLNSLDLSFIDKYGDVDYNIDWQGTSRLQSQINGLQGHDSQSYTIGQRDSYLEEALKADPDWAKMLAGTI